ncbi:hypothetical protein MKZ38_005435 [Zalerion maritima]|uniref:Prion-inhibition and propagation HeLo domain-containing protein n=1 Tax=Zalerion maritima TaxID=339359 RepID=A0AAD5RLB3_9PEZI|nr:hypothetical protein MKZ38_005435 [Zalerion maritima]
MYSCQGGLDREPSAITTLEVPAFILGVVGIFSSCVDAFSYFKSAQHAEREKNASLFKLDIQKERLLVWANEIELFSHTNHDRNLKDQSNAQLVERTLVEIHRLLTDANTLRDFYGVHPCANPLAKPIEYVSSRSMSIFRAASGRFWTRNAYRLNSRPRSSTLARINNLNGFIDDLYELVPVPRDVVQSTIVANIESVSDTYELGLIVEATEDSFPIFSDAASSAKARTEAGTADRRNLAEYLEDTTGGSPDIRTRGLPGQMGADLLFDELQSCRKHFILTTTCPRLSTILPCGVSQAGSDALAYSQSSNWNILATAGKPWESIRQLIDISSRTQRFISDHEVFLSTDSIFGFSDIQKAFLSSATPLLRLALYCSPCTCQIHTCIAICQQLESQYLSVTVRPHDRLPSSCCHSSDGVAKVKGIIKAVSQWMSGCWKPKIGNARGNLAAATAAIYTMPSEPALPMRSPLEGLQGKKRDSSPSLSSPSIGEDTPVRGME